MNGQKPVSSSQRGSANGATTPAATLRSRNCVPHAVSDGPQLFASSSLGHTYSADAFASEDDDLLASTARREVGAGDTGPVDFEAVETESVVQEGRQLLLQFIMTEMQRERRRLARGDGQVAGPSSQHTGGYTAEWNAQDEDVNDAGSSSMARFSSDMTGYSQKERQIVDALTRIGDAMERDRQLNSLIDRLPPEANWETFRSVAGSLFSQEISWGRIVALFYFAFRLVQRSISNTPMIGRVLDLAGKVIKLYLAQWIIRRGGWRAVMEWFGPAWSQIGMAFGVFCVVCFVWKARSS